MKTFPIPVTVFRAGPTQPRPNETVEIEPSSMPQAEPLVTPAPPGDASDDELAAASDVVEQILRAMRAAQRSTRFGAGSLRLSLADLEPGARHALNQSLGQGEVSALVRGADGRIDWRIQETAFAGLWRVQSDDPSGADLLEAGDLPESVKLAARAGSAAQFDCAQLPEGEMNAPALVHELRARARQIGEGRPAQVINLSLLPLNAADHAGLATLLGEGPVSILSRGFGDCRIASTRAQGVWRVRYFNSMNTLLLDTIEVVALPEAARATAEDYADSIERLEELLGWMRGD